MATIAGVKLADMKKPKASLSPANVGKLSPDPYSYEHRISLDQDALDKLKVGDIPKVGDKFHVFGEGHVHEVSDNTGPDGKRSVRVGLQLRRLGVKKPTATPSEGSALDAVNKGVKEAG